MSPVPTHLFSCDWGTSSFRLRLVDRRRGDVLGEIADANGARVIASSLADQASPVDRAAAFRRTLRNAIASLPDSERFVLAGTPVVVSGMASSSIGWLELPYARLPFAVDGSQAVCEWLTIRVNDRELPVLLVSGLASDTEIMRGEETQLTGLLARPEFSALADDCVVVLPGTHSKHIRVRDGSAIGLHTYMTGELFQVLREHSVLRFTTGGDAERTDEAAFLEGVTAAREHGALRMLFRTRTRGVLGKQEGPANRDFLSGLLIGAELAELSREPGAAPILLAPGSLGRAYETAARAVGLGGRMVLATREQIEAAVSRGHIQLHDRFSGG